MGYPKSKFHYAGKNLKNTPKILKKLYFIPFEYIIFPHSRQKDSSICRTSRPIFYARLVELRAQICHNTREIDIHECGSSKLSFIIVSSSRNVKGWSLLSSVWIVLTDSSDTTFKRPVQNWSCTSHCPSQNSRHRFLIICMLWHHYHTPRAAVCEFQSHSYFSPLKTVPLHVVHSRTRMQWVTPCSSYYSSRSFERSDQPKIHCCHNPKQNISLNFHSIWTIRWRGKKMGNLLLGQPT